MCEFEDWPIISKYTRQQAVDDGVLVKLWQYKGKDVVVTTHLHGDFDIVSLTEVWQEFLHWDKFDKPCLPEEDQLFHTGIGGKTVWVIEDAESFTLMYPEDY